VLDEYIPGLQDVGILITTCSAEMHRKSPFTFVRNANYHLWSAPRMDKMLQSNILGASVNARSGRRPDHVLSATPLMLLKQLTRIPNAKGQVRPTEVFPVCSRPNQHRSIGNVHIPDAGYGVRMARYFYMKIPWNFHVLLQILMNEERGIFWNCN